MKAILLPAQLNPLLEHPDHIFHCSGNLNRLSMEGNTNLDQSSELRIRFESNCCSRKVVPLMCKDITLPYTTFGLGAGVDRDDGPNVKPQELFSGAGSERRVVSLMPGE